MSRVPVAHPVALFIALAVFAPALHASQFVGATPQEVEIEDIEKQNVVLGLADGSRIVAGHLGRQAAGCPGGTQAYARRENAQGGTIWERFAHAGTGCTGTGSDGDSLLEGVTSIDPAYFIASSAASAVDSGTGQQYYAISSLIAWETVPDGVLKATWGLLLIAADKDGNRVADTYFGAQPEGVPTDGATCDVVCEALAVENDQYSGTALAVAGNGLHVTGWKRAAITEGHYTTDKDVLTLAVSSDLASLKWLSAPSFDGNDVGLAIAVASWGHTYVTGYYGTQLDFFVASFLPGGALYRVFVAGGPKDDWGYSVTVDESAAELVVMGTFTDEVTVEERQIGAPDNGPIAFTARFDPLLELLSLVTSADDAVVFGMPGQGVPPPACGGPSQATPQQPLSLASVGRDVGDGEKRAKTRQPRAGRTGGGTAGPRPGEESHQEHVYEPTAIDVTIGEKGSGTIEAVAASDDCYLHLLAQLDPTAEVSEAVFEIELMDGAPVPKEITLEFGSEYCLTVDVAIGGGNGSGWQALETLELCPLEEPRFTIPVPADKAAALGFVDGARVELMPPLQVRTTFNFHGAPCAPDPFQLCSSSGGKDCDVDDLDVTSDYGA